MNQTAAPLKVALVDLDNKPVPDWVPEKLRGAGIDLAIHDCRTGGDLAQHAGAAEIVWLFGGSRILAGGNLDLVPHCWGILRTGSGTDNVPVEEATRRGIVVANTPAAFSDPVADHALALLLALVRRLPLLDRSVRAGVWDQTLGSPLSTLQGGTLGLVGFGGIARDLAHKVAGFEMKLLAHDPLVSADAMQERGVRSAPLDELLREADFVSLHCPLTPRTRHLIGEKELRSMKPTAVLINTSRGPVVEERALIRALGEGWIAAAGLDVLEAEPPGTDHPFWQMDNVIVTPHSAGLSVHGIEARWRLSVDTVLAFARGHWPPSCVNRDVRPRRALTAPQR